MAKSQEFLISSAIGLIIDYPLIHIKGYTAINAKTVIISIDELAKINQIVNNQIQCLKGQVNATPE